MAIADCRFNLEVQHRIAKNYGTGSVSDRIQVGATQSVQYGSGSDRIQVGATQSVQYGSGSDRIQVTSYSILDLDTTRIISDPELDLIAG